MGKAEKRKREVDTEIVADQPPAKTQLIDDGFEANSLSKLENSNGLNRQLKSERRKKSAVQSKHKNIKTSDHKPAATSTAQPIGTQDDLSAGKDSASLTETNSNITKEKRRSPRAIRKERIQAQTQDTSKKATDLDSKAPPKASDTRFICFVGNLPYTATSDQITKHFAKLQPKSVRLMTDKKTGKPKGFAFVEFDNYDKMKTCLKLYHHSIFDPDGEAGDKDVKEEVRGNVKSRARKINVELTAGGGGGKSSGRRDKIKAKNQKLDEERSRDWEKKKQEEQKNSKGQRPHKKGLPGSGANVEQIDNSSAVDRGDIHPSRMNRVRG